MKKDTEDVKKIPKKIAVIGKLCLKYFMSNRFLVIALGIVGGFFAVFADFSDFVFDYYAFFEYFILGFNAVAFVAGVILALYLIKNKKRSVVLVFVVTATLFCLFLLIFNLAKNNSNIKITKLSLFLPMVTVLTHIVLVDIINIINFVKENYDCLFIKRNKTEGYNIESYDLVEKSNMHVDPITAQLCKV